MLARIVALVLLGTGLAVRASAADKPLLVDHAQSRIEIAVKATVDSFTGRLTAFDPVITLDDSGAIRTARVDFHFRDVVTGKAGRDKAMHKWQQTDAHPDAQFVLKTLTPVSGAVSTACGQLTLHGVTRELCFPVTVNRDGPRYALDGDAAIDTRDFNLPIIRMMGVLKVDPVVHVRFHLQGATTSAALTHIRR